MMAFEKEVSRVSFWQSVLRVMDKKMDVPEPYEWFHLMWFAIVIGGAVALLVWHRKSGSQKRVANVVLGVSLVVVVMEIYKLVNYSFSYEDGIVFDFQWYAFPWQFCSTPMYVGVLAGLIRKGKVHDALCAYLATYSLFAGAAVMFYPGDVFIGTIGVNIQTMFCHGSMIAVAIYLMGSGHVKLEHKTILKALPVFTVTLVIAMILNEVAYRTGLLETDTFNMFYISPYCDPHLPVYSMVQETVAYPWCLLLYIAGFTAAAYLLLLLAMGIRKVASGKKTAVATV